MLGDTELRVLGCLIEKQMTTPEYYPLSRNALVAACNQKNNRDPVVSYDETEVIGGVDGLRELGLCRTVRRPGQRTEKYRHAADEALRVDGEQLSLLAVLTLRGPQTVGELRTRTERYCDFSSLAEVLDVLGGLASREEPLVERLERRPGEVEPRWRHLLGAAESTAAGAVDDPAGFAAEAVPDVSSVEAVAAEVAELRSDLDVLSNRVDRLMRSLGGIEPATGA